MGKHPGHRLLLGALALISSFCAPAQTLPSTTTAAVQSLTATITGVEGVVQVRSAETSPWLKATVGMTIGQGAEFRTGPRSAVRFVLPPEQVITLDRLGTVKLIEAIRNNQKVKTDLGMQYGRVRYDIEAAGQEHDSKIHSPGASLAVRGTNVSLFDQPPFKAEAVSLTGVAQFRNARRQTISFGSKGKNKKSEVRSDSDSAAQTAQVSTALTDFAVQRADQQARELAFLFQQQFDLVGNTASSATPVTNAQLPQLLGDARLNFVLRWSSRGIADFADLNILVSNAKRETFGNPPFFLSALPNHPALAEFERDAFPPTSPSGGTVGLNHIGPEGIEIASFGAKAPPSTYVVGAYNAFLPSSGSKPVGTEKIPFRIEVFLDGKRQDLIVNLDQVLAGKEEPVFGKVYRDEIGAGELSSAAVRITDPARRSSAVKQIKLTPPAHTPRSQPPRPRQDSPSRRPPSNTAPARPGK